MNSRQTANLIFSLPLFLLVASCAAGSNKEIVGPDGTQNQLISCAVIEGCYAKAREVCNGTYKIVNTTSENVGDTTFYKLLVKCDH